MAGLLAGVFYYSLTLNVPADDFGRVVVKAKDWGIYTLVAWLVWPFFRLIYRVVFKRWDLIDALFDLNDFLMLYLLAGAAGVVWAVNGYLTAQKSPYLKYVSSGYVIGWGVVVFIVIAVLFRLFVRYWHRVAYAVNAALIKRKSALPFGLWLGRSTGHLASLAHGASMAPNQDVTLSLTDACQNILVLGGIGAGKTTRAVQPLLLQLLDQDCGGLIFDIKGDFKAAACDLVRATDREIAVIGPGQRRINLLHGLTPEVAGSFLKSAFMLSGYKSDPFWIDSAAELCRNALGVLSFVPDQYSLNALYNYLFDPDFRLETDDRVRVIENSLDVKQTRLLDTYRGYREHIFSSFDEKVVSGINATAAQALSPFNHPDLVDAFCTGGEGLARMENVLNGEIFLVDLPLSLWGLGGKVVYTFIKLRFFNVMQRRNAVPELNQDRPVFFMCDEFQEIVSCNKDGLSDLNFWDKARSSKTIGIISGQSVASFYAAVGNRDLCDALLQNFRQKVCFRTEDQTTIEYLYRLMGRVEVVRESYSKGTQKNILELSDRSESRGTSVSVTAKAVLDPQTIRGLEQNQALAVLSIGDQSMDDVVSLVPVFA